jgi:hypothetical protein
MPTDSYTLGAGTLTLGTAPDDKQYAMQLTNCRVEPSESVDEGDDMNLLDGTTLSGADVVSYDYVLAGTAVQDLNVLGFTDYCWVNKGLTVAFKFIPVTARGAAVGVTGSCRIRPITIGGDVKKRNTSDFEFTCIGTPVWTPDSTP